MYKEGSETQRGLGRVHNPRNAKATQSQPVFFLLLFLPDNSVLSFGHEWLQLFYAKFLAL